LHPRAPRSTLGDVRRPWSLIGVALVASCGPSVSAIYESNARFEHCYRLDLDPDIAPTHRRACWREWSERYTVGQTNDRFDHARARLRSLDSGDGSTMKLRIGAEADGGTAQVAVAPTSLHAPPPAIAPLIAVSASAAPPGPSSSAAPLPSQECTSRCEATLASCRRPCGGVSDRGCQICDKDYGRCMQRCFR
jgi:hypothetical protein